MFSRRQPRRHRGALNAAVGEMLGLPVAIAVPLQRRRPAWIFTACLAELAALAALIVTGSNTALVLLALVAVGLLGLSATNAHRILAITSNGVVVLVASPRGRPQAMVDTAPRDLALPVPAGLGVALTLRGQTWWVDRSGFPRLERARQLLQPNAETGGTTEAG
jgi:hypothetical protein